MFSGGKDFWESKAKEERRVNSKDLSSLKKLIQHEETCGEILAQFKFFSKKEKGPSSFASHLKEITSGLFEKPTFREKLSCF